MSRNAIYPAAFAVVLLFIWYFLASSNIVSSLILPGPLAVIKSMGQNADQLAYNSFITALNSMAGLMIATLVSFVLCMFFFFSRRIQLSVYPFAIALKATPLVAIAPLIVLAMGSGASSKIAMAAIVAFFPIMVAFWDGITRVNQEWKDTFTLLGASKSQSFFQLYLPGASLDLMSGLKVASTLAVVGAIIAEFTGASEGIGFLIKTGTYYLDMSLVFGGIFCAAAVGLLFFLLVTLAYEIAERRLSF